MSQPADPSQSARAARSAESAQSAGSAGPAEGPERRIYTIAQLLGGLRRLLEDRVGQLWIVGEVSNLHHARSGHSYFSLKDDVGQVRAVLFRASAQRLRFDLEEGLEVLVYADVTVYEARGDLQLIVREVEPRGQGALQLAFEQLRARLEAEGVFDESRKLPLPEHPRAIAIVTSPTSAAVRDVIQVAGQRLPGVPLYVLPTRVQGEGAEREIAAALDAVAAITGRGARPRTEAEGEPAGQSEGVSEPGAGRGSERDSESVSSSLPSAGRAQIQLDFAPPAATDPTAGFEHGHLLDVVLLVRGGGSLEDLMCFNTEVVARAIAACPLPVVSGVGHEVDLTIADLVADFRAPTPSAAAAAVLPDRRALVVQLRKDWSRLVAAISSRIRQSRADWLREQDALRVLAPSAKLAGQRARLGAAMRALRRASGALSERQRARLSELAARLDTLSPLAVLGRGYALVRRARDGEIVRQADQLSAGESLVIRVASARIEALVESVEPVSDTARTSSSGR